MDHQDKKPRPIEIDLAPQHRLIEKPWGWEVIWAEGNLYIGKLLHIRAGQRISLQYHDQKVETQCLLTGRAVLIAEDEDGFFQETPMETGKGYTIRPYQIHRVLAIEDTEIVEVSTPERGTTVRLEDDYGRSDETEAMRSLPHRGWGGVAARPGGSA